MYLTKKRDHHWFIKLPVLAVYLLFFTVQIFFNLDITHRAFADQHTNVSLVKTVHAENVNQCGNKLPGSSKIRLNKRFQPSSLPYTLPSITEMPIVYGTFLRKGLYNGDLYASVFLYTHSLRGPPVVA